ncbi:hypothetical protein ACW73L_18330 [Methylolobus aquaticus]
MTATVPLRLSQLLALLQTALFPLPREDLAVGLKRRVVHDERVKVEAASVRL